MRRLLLLNMNDQASRDFIGSLEPNEFNDYSLIIDWYNPEHLPLVEKYLLDRHYPSPSTFPTVWVELPMEYTYTNFDQVARISGFTKHKEVIDEAAWAMVEAIIEAVQMSEEYKMNYIMDCMMMSNSIKPEALLYFQGCKDVEQMKRMHNFLIQNKMLVKDEYLIKDILDETGENFGEVIILQEPEERVALPANFGKSRLPTLKVNN